MFSFCYVGIFTQHNFPFISTPNPTLTSLKLTFNCFSSAALDYSNRVFISNGWRTGRNHIYQFETISLLVPFAQNKYLSILWFNWLLSYEGSPQSYLQVSSDGCPLLWSCDHILGAWQPACIYICLPCPTVMWLHFMMLFLPETGTYFRFLGKRWPMDSMGLLNDCHIYLTITMFALPLQKRS